MKIIINTSLCKGSGECLKICPHKAIKIISGKAVIDNAKCDGDGICIPACPHNAIRPA